MSEPRFHMHAESLLSKWGFGDGDALSDWWWDTFDYDPHWDAHEVLFELVKAHLIPEIERRGHRVELVFISTIHNPVRAERLNGAEVDWYGEPPSLPISVSVTREQILAAVRAAEVRSTEVIRCDYCGDALPSVKSRAHIPTTPNLQRLGFAADKVVCPECVARVRSNNTEGGS